jgi:8-hydroxy-5-deazaflavin:NADPH oxidoreductase
VLFRSLCLSVVLISSLFIHHGARAEVASGKEIIAVIGTGRMGAAAGPRLAAVGHTVIYGTRDPSSEKMRELLGRSPGAKAVSQRQAVQSADLVLLAIPWFATEEFVASSGPWSGKLIMDMVNASKMGDDGLLEVAVDTSAGELIQSWATGATVVKTFNTVSYHIIADPSIAKGLVTIPLASNDAEAKARVAAVVESIGMEPFDAGPLRFSRALEHMSTLHMVPYLQDRWEDAYEFYFVTGTAPLGATGVRLAK